MTNYLIVFPHQLHRDHYGLQQKPDKIILIEDSLFFLDHQYPVNFHRQKLILHRASMQQYRAYLESLDFDVDYREHVENVLEKTLVEIHSNDVRILIADTVDYALNKRIKTISTKAGLTVEWLKSQLFINSNKENLDYRAGKKRWFMANFYQFQRKRLDILMQNGEPVGGQWSFDEDNRKKIPKKNIPHIPTVSFPDENAYVKEAKLYVRENFPNALGADDEFFYPSNFDDADAWLQQFFKHRFDLFGPYEDALVPEHSWLYHSVLTPMLNIGLLNPLTIVHAAIEYSHKHDVKLSSVEGFIRQIIGWREFMRATYIDHGVTMRTTNHWQHTRKIPASFYDGTTGIAPIDDVIKRVLQTGYCHHIERLMVLGGFMFLCEFDPDDIYRWFMELFVDSYDWVMVTNAYAMSQNADGGLITTKPYFSGSSYLKKMGYSQSKEADLEWSPIWDGLYWRWIHINTEQLAKNHRWAMMCSMVKKMPTEKLTQHLSNADKFLTALDT